MDGKMPQPFEPADEGSTTPHPPIGNPPALTRMATVGNVLQKDQKPFDIVEEYQSYLRRDPELTMPVAAIEALIELLSRSNVKTIFETLDLLAVQSRYLKSKIPNPISLSAGTDLFQRYIVTFLKSSGEGSFDEVRTHLLNNAATFVKRAKESRHRIASYGKHFVRDGCTVLTHGGSRVVGTLLANAAEASTGGGSVRFKVIYVMNGARITESKTVVTSLRVKGVPVATISEGAVAYSMGKVDLVIVGAEGVVENGGIISRLGTYQIGLLARAAEKPFYVVAESHKFVRIYPLGQYDLPIEQKVIEFKTADEEFAERTERPDYFTEKMPAELLVPKSAVDAVDYTPPHLISALITDTGVLSPSAVSEQLIQAYL